MSVIGKLALTVVMLALGAAPALTLASDPFLPGGREAPTQPAATPPVPAAEPVHQGEDPGSGVAFPDLAIPAIPRTEAEWAEWTELNVGWDEASSDAFDDAGFPDGWPDIEPFSEAGTEGEGSEPRPEDDPYFEPGINPDSEPGINPYFEPEDEEAPADAPVEDETEDGGGLLGILG